MHTYAHAFPMAFPSTGRPIHGFTVYVQRLVFQLGQHHSDTAWLAYRARSSTCGARERPRDVRRQPLGLDLGPRNIGGRAGTHLIHPPLHSASSFAASSDQTAAPLPLQRPGVPYGGPLPCIRPVGPSHPAPLGAHLRRLCGLGYCWLRWFLRFCRLYVCRRCHLFVI